MVKLTIDGIEVEVPPGSNAGAGLRGRGGRRNSCASAITSGAERAAPAGCAWWRSYREGAVLRSRLPPAWRTSVVAEGMVVHTDSPMVKKARRGVMEFLPDQIIRWIARSADQGGESAIQQ